MELTLSSVSLGGKKAPKPAGKKTSKEGFVHSMLSFTRLEIPEVEVFETAVTFDAATDPLTAHDALNAVFGQKAGFGRFLFRADSTIPGRFWVRSVEPWTRWPERALNALEPRRKVIQLAEGLMYHFSLHVCAGEESVTGNEKRVQAFETSEQVAAWFRNGADDFGIRPLVVNITLRTARFAHGQQRFKVPYATLDGALEVAHADRLRRRIVKGFGYYRRTGLGMLELSN